MKCFPLAYSVHHPLSVMNVVLLDLVLLTVQDAVYISQLTQSAAITMGANVLFWGSQARNWMQPFTENPNHVACELF